MTIIMWNQIKIKSLDLLIFIGFYESIYFMVLFMFKKIGFPQNAILSAILAQLALVLFTDIRRLFIERRKAEKLSRQLVKQRTN